MTRRLNFTSIQKVDDRRCGPMVLQKLVKELWFNSQAKYCLFLDPLKPLERVWVSHVCAGTVMVRSRHVLACPHVHHAKKLHAEVDHYTYLTFNRTSGTRRLW